MKEIHFPPYMLRIGLFRRSEIKYIDGTISSVIKNAKINPKMLVHESGFQNTELSPSKKICGLSSENKVMKLILKPTAIGKKPRIAANAVNSTGMILVFPA